MFYNSHLHLFKAEDVPNKFLPFGLVNILQTKFGNMIITKILRNLLPFTDRDILDRFARFAKTGKLGSQKKIFERCLKSYPEDTKFIILPMDMEYMGAGKVDRDYYEQIDELADLKKYHYPDNIIPFFMVDPRRPEFLEMLKYAVEDKGFKGVKLYPPLGYFPYDKRLDPVYEYCQEKNIPVITHCGPSGVYYQGKKKKLKKLLTDGNPNIKPGRKGRKKLCHMFSHPNNYIPVIKKYPKLRICFAHFGSGVSWERYVKHGDEENSWLTIIKRMLLKYPNVYTDISFTLNNRKFFPVLKNFLQYKRLRSKILFGSDFYMVEKESNEKRFGKELRKFIGEKNFRAIAVDNPKNFLG